MEPFITRNGALLIFNDQNTPGFDTDLHLAERLDATTFEYRGRLAAANSSELDAVASVGPDGFVYFVSVRSYEETLSTLYRVPLLGSGTTDVELVPGLRNDTPGIIHFDLEITPDGGAIYYVVGRFSDRSIPDEANLAIAVSDRGGFQPDSAGDRLLAAVNTDDLEYAPATSTDQRILFFTRVEIGSDVARIWYSLRADPNEPWGPPVELTEAPGFVEAVTVTGSGDGIYYHVKIDDFHELRYMTVDS